MELCSNHEGSSMADDERHADDTAGRESADAGAETNEWGAAARTELKDSTAQSAGGATAEPDATNQPSRNETDQIDRPPGRWRGDGDPTGSSTWRWLTWATAFSGFVLVFWTVPLVLFGALDRTGLAGATTGGAFAVLGLFLVAAAVRFVVLPVLLFRDAGKLRRTDEVEWHPERSFYLATGAFFATLACAYYLYKRARHVGNPRFLNSDELLYYEGRTVRSNWFRLILVTPLLSGLGGFGPVFDAIAAVSEAAATAASGPLLALVGVALLLRFVLLPVAFVKDAAAVRDADVDWEPNGALYAVIGYVFALPVTAVYLYRRHNRTESLF